MSVDEPDEDVVINVPVVWLKMKGKLKWLGRLKPEKFIDPDEPSDEPENDV